MNRPNHSPMNNHGHEPKILPIRAAFATLLMLLSFAAAAPAIAQEQGAASLPLWEVTHQGNTVYLMGSVHMLRPEVYPLDDALYEAFDAAEVVAFELDLPVAMVEQMKPWLVSLTLSSVVMQQAGFEAAAGIDLHFHERAKAANRTIIGLETMQDQIVVFEGLDDAGQVAFVRSTLEQLDTSVDQLDEATEYWRHGDVERLAEMFTESMGDQPVLMERILFERNRNWIPQIEALLQTPETAIVIVGIGHLVGEGSVIELLEKRGYSVRRWSGQPAAVGASR